jgi:hypothetical protein
MSNNRSQIYEYQLGGSLSPDAPSYVKRKADEDLYQALMSGRYCYALNSRQMGKSSLRVRARERLKEKGVDCATIDIAGVTSDDIKPDEWYFGVAYTLDSELKLFNESNEVLEWWQTRDALAPAQRLADYIDSKVLEKVRESEQNHLVVFVDEIDSLFKLKFGDDFFDLIRNCHGKRAIQEEYRRLTFALMGVADPADLVKDKRRPPFNIGEAISLTGFEFEEARQSLIPGLINKSSNPDKLLQGILSWTEGQPFLTQKICDLAAKESSSPADGDEATWLGELIQKKIVENWEERDTPIHFRAIQGRILYNKNQRTGRLLGLYQSILRGDDAGADSSPDQMELRLAGLVVVKDRTLRISNRIYRAIFDEKWVEKRLSELRPYSEVLQAWLESERKDDSRLLRGQALKAANEWAVGKKLSDEDYEFLAASEKLKTQGIERALNIEEEEKGILLAAKEKADKRVRIGGAILALTLIVSGFAVAYGVKSVGRARSAQQETETNKKELEVVKTESSVIQSTLSHANFALAQAKIGLGTITSELDEKRAALTTSRKALLDLQTTLGSTKTKLADASAKLKAVETSLENKEFDTYLAKIKSDAPQHGDYSNTVGTYVTELIGSLKARGSHYQQRVSAIKSEIREYKFQAPQFVEQNRQATRIRKLNRVYQLILYKGTDDQSCKQNFLNSFREEANELKSRKDDEESFSSLDHFIDLFSWNQSDRKELTLLAADFILNYKLGESAKRDLFSAIWGLNLSDVDAVVDDFLQNDPQRFLELVKNARDILRHQTESVSYYGVDTFLSYFAPQAFLIYSGQSLILANLPSNLRNEILTNVLETKNERLMTANCPETGDQKAWEAWLANANNALAVSLWNEPELTTLKKNPALLRSLMNLWR